MQSGYKLPRLCPSEHRATGNEPRRELRSLKHRHNIRRRAGPRAYRTRIAVLPDLRALACSTSPNVLSRLRRMWIYRGVREKRAWTRYSPPGGLGCVSHALRKLLQWRPVWLKTCGRISALLFVQRGSTAMALHSIMIPLLGWSCLRDNRRVQTSTHARRSKLFIHASSHLSDPSSYSLSHDSPRSDGMFKCPRSTHGSVDGMLRAREGRGVGRSGHAAAEHAYAIIIDALKSRRQQ